MFKILELTKQKRETLAQSTATGGPESSKTPAKGGFPLWPLGAGLGLLGIGYGIYMGGKDSSNNKENDAPPVTAQKPTFFNDPIGAVSDFAFRAKVFVQDHPYTSLAVGIGALAMAAGLAGPSLLAGGGGMVLSGGGAAAMAPAAATPVAAGTLLLMAKNNKDLQKTDKGQSTQPKGDEKKDKIDVEDVVENPNLLSGKTPQEADRLIERTSNWKTEMLGRGDHKGQGWALREYDAAGRKTGRLIRWHPGGGHHGPRPYWKVSSPKGGVSPVIR